MELLPLTLFGVLFLLVAVSTGDSFSPAFFDRDQVEDIYDSRDVLKDTFADILDGGEKAPSFADQDTYQLAKLLSNYLEHSAQKRDPSTSSIDSFMTNENGSSGHHGLFKHMNWQIALIGVVACMGTVFGVTLAATMYIRQKRLVRMTSPESEIGGGKRSTSPHDSLIGLDLGDKKLAHSAQMYHYQHQKQQMLAMERAVAKNNHVGEEDDEDESDPDLDETDFTVYECPGLATTGELEVKNPLFEGNMLENDSCSDDISPNSSSQDDEFTELGISPLADREATPTATTVEKFD